jgi:uroporphyrinogen III methyltransferase/synthase
MSTVLVSPADPNQALSATLKQSGVRCLSSPHLQVGPPCDDSQLRDAIENIFGYDWLILKNPRAAEYFVRSFLADHRQDELDELRILTIGSETSEQANSFQIHVDIAIERFATGTVYDALKDYVGDVEPARLNVLIPNANISRELFEEQLEAGGARVDSVATYRTCSNSDELTKLKTLLAGGGIDGVAFSSASSIDEFAYLFDTEDLQRLLQGVEVFCADQLTTQAANEFGLSQTSMPSSPSADHLVDLIKTSAK